MFDEDKKIHTRQYSVRMPDSLSGGPDIDFSSAMTNIMHERQKVKERVQKAVKRLEDKETSRAINVAYLDGFEVRDGDVYYVMRAVFQLIPTLKVVWNAKSS